MSNYNVVDRITQYNKDLHFMKLVDDEEREFVFL